jgi:hypothetical protein
MSAAVTGGDVTQATLSNVVLALGPQAGGLETEGLVVISLALCTSLMKVAESTWASP